MPVHRRTSTTRIYLPLRTPVANPVEVALVWCDWDTDTEEDDNAAAAADDEDGNSIAPPQQVPLAGAFTVAYATRLTRCHVCMHAMCTPVCTVTAIPGRLDCCWEWKMYKPALKCFRTIMIRTTQRRNTNAFCTREASDQKRWSAVSSVVEGPAQHAPARHLCPTRPLPAQNKSVILSSGVTGYFRNCGGPRGIAADYHRDQQRLPHLGQPPTPSAISFSTMELIRVPK